MNYEPGAKPYESLWNPTLTVLAPLSFMNAGQVLTSASLFPTKEDAEAHAKAWADRMEILSCEHQCSDFEFKYTGVDDDGLWLYDLKGVCSECGSKIEASDVRARDRQDLSGNGNYIPWRVKE